jgi:methionine-gamma-lyase
MKKFNPEKALQKAKREFGEFGGVCPSIDRSSTFTVLEPGTMPEIFDGLKGPDTGGCFLYSRHFNPTVDVLARYLAAMEGSGHAICTASGMSAISCTLLQLCRSGDHIVSSDTVYGGTHALFEEVLPDMGIETTFVDPSDTAAFAAAVTPKTKVIYTETLGNPTLKVAAAVTPKTKVIYTETLGNPTLKVADIPALGKLADTHGIKLVVDNTFTPAMITPIALGAHVVIYSLTKFVNGASDMIAGVICATREFIYELMDLHTGRVMLLGPTMDPRSAFDLIQRLPTLPLRMREHSRRALALARHAAALGAPISYPGLESHPQHQLLGSMINDDSYGYGGMMTIDCKTPGRGDKLLEVLQNEERFGLIAVSLGYFDTLMSCSGSTTSSEISDEDQAKMGLSPGLIRFSIGYTGDLEDRKAQFERGLRKVGIIE